MPAATRTRHALLYPLGVYVATRLLFLFATATGPQLTSPKPLLREFLVRWDAGYYLSIARDGYPRGSDLAAEHAFFPLYPLALRIGDLLVPQGFFTSGVVVSYVAGACAVVLLWHFAEILSGRETADVTVVVFCLFPGTIVFGWTYADALLLAFICGSLLLLAQGRWLAAAGVAALASATRPSGLVLVVACAWVAYSSARGTPQRRALVAAGTGALAASGFVVFMLWLWQHTGNAFQWLDVEREMFGEGTVSRVGTTVADVFRHGPAYSRQMIVLFSLIAVVLLVVGLMARQPGWAKLVTVLALYLALTANIATSSPRLQTAAVPAFVALGAKLRAERLLAWSVGSAVLATVLIFVYGLTVNVAP